MFSYALA